MRLSRLPLVIILVALVSLWGGVATSAYADQPSPKPRQQLLYEQAESARVGGSVEEAGKILAGMDAGYWSAVGYLNLSGDYARNDLNVSRALVALRVALAMADKDPDAERKKALRSRILLRAGYLAYKHSEYEKAVGFFERIPLDSHVTPQALYFHGLALAEQGHHRAAMQSWHRAKKYPLAYPGVAEAWIGMGRGYDLSGYLGQAGEAYLAANVAYESERVTLRTLTEQINGQGAYKTLVLDARGAKVDWFLADSRTLTQPRMAYLFAFMEQPAAQNSVNQVADLAQMAADLERRAQDLAIFSTAISDQLESPGMSEQSANKEALKDSNAKLKERLKVILEGVDARGFTAGQRVQLNGIKTTLSDSRKQLDSLQRRSAQRSDNLKALATKARKLRKQAVAHLDDVAVLRAQAEARLDRLALEFVAAQDKKMVYALDKTEQQIAHLYEYLALEKLDAGGRTQ